jgi:hypothetical protein
MVTAISWRAHPTEICTTPVSPVSIFSLLPIHFQIPTARARPVSTPPGDLGHLRAQYSRNHLRGRYDTAHRRIRYVKIRETPGRTAPLYHLPCLTSQLAKKGYRTVRDTSKPKNLNRPRFSPNGAPPVIHRDKFGKPDRLRFDKLVEGFQKDDSDH